ncbi:MAG: hypothetical protein AB8B55_05775 [Mariniblastus sp.]
MKGRTMLEQPSKQIRRRLFFIIIWIAFAVLPSVGCGGPVGNAIQGLQDLEPEIDKRNQEIENAAKPKQ